MKKEFWQPEPIGAVLPRVLGKLLLVKFNRMKAAELSDAGPDSDEEKQAWADLFQPAGIQVAEEASDDAT